MKILQVLSSLGGSGGVQRLLVNYYRHMDQEKIQFDFIVNDERVGELEPFFIERGSHIFHIPSKHRSLSKNLCEMNRVIKAGNYDIIHVHQDWMSIFPIALAKRAHIPKRIAHSHLAFRKTSLFKRGIIGICKFLLKKTATDWWACSKEAGTALWGKEAVRSGKVYIMKNAIDIEAFKYDPLIREQVREALKLQDRLVIGCVGRFVYQKNHEKLMSIFREIYQKNDHAVLLLIGGGELEGQIRKQAEELGIRGAVKFLGIRNDVNELLQAMDVFLLPSRYEGLGIVYIESQAAGLECFASAKVVPSEVKITDLLHFISLEKSSKYWAEEVIHQITHHKNRVSPMEILRCKGYSIQEEAKKVESQYGMQ